MNQLDDKNYEIKKIEETQPIKNGIRKKSLDNQENINKQVCIDINNKNKEHKEDIMEIDSEDNIAFNEIKINVKQNDDTNNFVNEPNELSQKKEGKKNIQDKKEDKNIIEIKNSNINEKSLDKVNKDVFPKNSINKNSNNIENNINNNIEQENDINNNIKIIHFNEINKGNNNIANENQTIEKMISENKTIRKEMEPYEEYRKKKNQKNKEPKRKFIPDSDYEDCSFGLCLFYLFCCPFVCIYKLCKHLFVCIYKLYNHIECKKCSFSCIRDKCFNFLKSLGYLLFCICYYGCYVLGCIFRIFG